MVSDGSDDPTKLAGSVPAPPALAGHPRQVGPYRILRVIGEGGMGIVYDAEQTEPVHRRVALKMMKVGMDTAEVIARFEAERQALAVMDHPNIAAVLDAGASESGRPYFVMEQVHGPSLMRYCDMHRLRTRARIEIMVAICRAVQHAHQKGVIHRDLKPSNVLVAERDGHPHPKVIDFGIAKAVAQRLTSRTLVTAFGQAIGTPAYMSPEQAEMHALDVDTRTDIYALGVMLYELLVGRLPIDPEEVGLPRFIAQLAMGETDPPTPSSRYASLANEQAAVARARATGPQALARELKGDLDWIVMKAMDRDRTRRYETANELAIDLERYLASEPIGARPPSASYRVQKFVQRHTAGVAFAAALALLVVSFAVVMGVQAGVIARERDRAEQEAAKAQTVNAFMQETLLAPDPVAGLGRDVTVAEALGTAAARLDDAFPDQPEVEANARSAIGWAYFQLGRYDEAEPQLERALELRRRVLGPAHPDLAESIEQWAELKRVRTEYGAAEALLHEAIAMRRDLLGPDDPSVATSLKDLAVLLEEAGRYDEAQTALQEAMRIQRPFGEASAEFADLQNQLGVMLWNQGQYDRLEPLWRQVLATRRAALGPDNPQVAESLNNLAVLLDGTGRSEEAERDYREALAILQRALGPDHIDVAAATSNLALVLARKGDDAEAERLYREALRIDREQLGDDNPGVATDLVNLASLLCEHDQPAEGLALVEEADLIFRAAVEPDNWRIGNTHQWKGQCLAQLGRYDEAERELMQGRDMLAAALGPDHWRVEGVDTRLAALHQASDGPAADPRATR